jgi:hypothetical protein
MPWGVCPAVMAVVVGTVNMTMTEFMTFAANEVLSHIDNGSVTPVA